MLAEDTAEHREIFVAGRRRAALYFDSLAETVWRQWLLSHDTERERLAVAAHALITRGKNTYGDRLAQIFDDIKLLIPRAAGLQMAASHSVVPEQ